MIQHLPYIHSSEETERYFTKLVDDGKVLVCKINDIIVSFMELEEGCLHHLYVAPQFQNKGFETMMLDHAKRVSPVGMSLWVCEDNKDAIRLYEREGFLLMEKKDKDEITNEKDLPDRLHQWPTNDKGNDI